MKSVKLNTFRRTERWNRLNEITMGLKRQNIYTQEILDAMDDNSEADSLMGERFLAF
jgi:hypothetical protein